MDDQQRFRELIAQLSELIELDDPNWIILGRPLMVDDIAFNVLHKKEDGDCFYIYADFGTVPFGDETTIYKNLLEANLGLYRGNGPGFSLSRQTSHVVYGECHQLGAITAEQLADSLAQISIRVKKWREDYVIRGAESGTYAKRSAAATQILRNMKA